MEIRNPLALRGPNMWASFPVMELWLDVNPWGSQTLGDIPGLVDRLKSILPQLDADHLRPDCTLAHAFAALDREFVRLSGATQPSMEFERIESTSEPGVYIIVYTYGEEYVTRECNHKAMAALQAALRAEPFDLATALNQLRDKALKLRRSPGTVAIISAAQRRGIPVIQLDEKGLLQLGHGFLQRRIRAGQTDRTGAIAHSVAEDKSLIHRMLLAVGVPTPTGYEVTDTEDAWKTAEYVGLPVTVKPAFTTEGRGVTIDLNTREEVIAAYEDALAESSSVIVEKHVSGRRYQLLVVGGMMVSAVRFDANGDPKDVTSRVHAEVESRAVTTAAAVGLDVAGIDIVAPNLSGPLEKQNGFVVDVHAAPRLEAHVTTPDSRRRVGDAFVRLLFPPGEGGRIPIAAITGTNGKTTVTRFLAHLLRGSGRAVGMSCTDGIYLDERRINKGDCSGPASARSVLMNPNVQIAVCETARGGILRAGLAFDHCDVAIVTNIGAGDHLGIHEIHTAEALSRVKRTIVTVVPETGAAVLNAVDPLTAKMAEVCRGKVIYFALDPQHPVMAAHLARRGAAIFVRDGWIVYSENGKEQSIVEAARIPMTYGGKVTFEIENALASIAAAIALNIDPAAIAERALSFATDLETVPTRFNVFEVRGATVVVDFGHNPDSLRAVIQALKSFPQERRITVYSSAGDRRDEDIIDMGEMLGNAFDKVILYEDNDRYKRAPGETIALLRQGLAKATRVKEIEEIDGGLNAFRHAWETAQPGELVLAQAHTADPTVEYLKKVNQQQ